MDPVTLAPTDILDPRAQAWIETVTGRAHASLKVSTKLSFMNPVFTCYKLFVILQGGKNLSVKVL